MSDVSTIFDLLAADHRRRVLGLLYETDSIQIPDDLQQRGSVGESLSEGGLTFQKQRIDGSSSRELEIQLTHNHLPKLANEEYIEWDPDTGTVSRGREFDEIEPVVGMLLANADTFPDDLL